MTGSGGSGSSALTTRATDTGSAAEDVGANFHETIEVIDIVGKAWNDANPSRGPGEGPEILDGTSVVIVQGHAAFEVRVEPAYERAQVSD